jgi:hypothetical protein
VSGGSSELAAGILRVEERLRAEFGALLHVAYDLLGRLSRLPITCLSFSTRFVVRRDEHRTA